MVSGLSSAVGMTARQSSKHRAVCEGKFGAGVGVVDEEVDAQ